jgi:hypothetical protein
MHLIEIVPLFKGRHTNGCAAPARLSRVIDQRGFSPLADGPPGGVPPMRRFLAGQRATYRRARRRQRKPRGRVRKSCHRYCILVAVLAFISLGGEARAWGDLGHKVICEIAFRLVQPETRAAIIRLIELDSDFKTFSDSCIYPDHPRIRAAEHFLNLPRDSKGLTSDECPLAVAPRRRTKDVGARGARAENTNIAALVHDRS